MWIAIVLRQRARQGDIVGAQVFFTLYSEGVTEDNLPDALPLENGSGPFTCRFRVVSVHCAVGTPTAKTFSDTMQPSQSTPTGVQGLTGLLATVEHVPRQEHILD